MKMSRIMGLAALSLFTVGVASATSIVTTVPFINTNNLGSLVSLQVRDDGRYDVICKNGGKEVANSVQLMLGSICPAGAIKTASFLSIQVTQDGKYSVICHDKDQSHHVVTSDDIANGRVCMTQAPSSDAVGTVNGHDFFKVAVTGAMTDANVLAACKAAGMEAPCDDVANGPYSDDKCLVVGLKDGGEPMQTLSRAICNGSDPNRCDKLDKTFQYMGQKWSGNACGSVGGSWCVTGSNMNALCVSAQSN
jgi:hypothetical protein